MTFGDVMMTVKGYFDHQIREWERSRLVAHTVYLGIPEKKGKAKKSLHKFLPLPSDTGFKNSVKYSHNDRVERLKAFREKSKGFK